MTQPVEKKCKDVIWDHYKGRMTELRHLWREDQVSLNEYGLSFDYVAPHTFGDQERGYFRYQLSWGGPSDEFRFYTNPDFSPYWVEYWFMDWFDGAHIPLTGDDKKFMVEFFQNEFVDTETCKIVHEKAMA
jgi:hypothetical protein